MINLAEAVKINRLRVPDMVKYGTEAILDCDFTLDERETDLVVKWYFNTALVYQWIPSKFNVILGEGFRTDYRCSVRFSAGLALDQQTKA